MFFSLYYYYSLFCCLVFPAKLERTEIYKKSFLVFTSSKSLLLLLLLLSTTTNDNTYWNRSIVAAQKVLLSFEFCLLLANNQELHMFSNQTTATSRVQAGRPGC